MSINVTVHGNPISIKKGKMVTYDADPEFDRRRRIRLQQVRQQSKEIAADVRKRVRKEKEKQLSKLEQKSEQDLKRWQARKLLALQQQYQDCLKEIGSAHTNAVLEPDPNEILHELAAKNQSEADLRGKVATEKKRNEDIQKRLELEKLFELKKNARKNENARSAMVTQLNKESSAKKKKQKRRKSSTDVTIYNKYVSESDNTENFISDGENISQSISNKKEKKKQKINIDLKSSDFSKKRKKDKRKSNNSTTDSSFGLSSPDLNHSIGTLSPTRSYKYNRSVISTNTTPELSPRKIKPKKAKDLVLSANTTLPSSSHKTKQTKSKDPISIDTITPSLTHKSKQTKSKDHILSTNTTPPSSPHKGKLTKSKDHILSTNTTPPSFHILSPARSEVSTNITPELSPRKIKSKSKDYILRKDHVLSSNSAPLLSPQNEHNKPIDYVLSTNTAPPPTPQKGKHKLVKDHEFSAVPEKGKSRDNFIENTKISDRIQQRKLHKDFPMTDNSNHNIEKLEQNDREIRKSHNRELYGMVDKQCSCECCLLVENHLNSIHNIESRGQKSSATYKPNLQIESYKICDIETKTKTSEPKHRLPSIPTITLRHDPIRNVKSDSTPCKYYDHSNRFSKEYNAQPMINKIDKGSIEVLPPSDRSETTELIQTLQARDRNARDRGVRALEKEKVHKDYKQLMNELPVLQRQERLASMRSHNPSFHMPEERLQELERRRQSRIENIFEKYYQKSKILETPLVTLRPVQKTPPAEEMKLPFRALDVTESPVQLNVAEWKSETKPSDFENGVQDQEDDLENKKKALVSLLQRVNKQRELLLQEVSTLPCSSNLQNILQDEEILELICPCPDKPSKTIQTEKNVVSTGTNPSLDQNTLKTKDDEKQTNKRGPVRSSSGDSSSEEIKKKKNKIVTSKKPKISIKDEGTQTSPLTSNYTTSSSKTLQEPKESEVSRKPTATNITDKCDCDKPYKKDAQNLCEIIIKMNDQTNVQVCKNGDEQLPSKQVTLNVSKPTKITVRSPPNGNDVSSSTTYMSIPDKPAQPKNTKPSSPSLNSYERQQYKDLLHLKPQQTNIDRTDNGNDVCTDICKKEITSTLLKYIQKLLSMSRQSIDELTVSSISEFSTPGNSIVDTVENTSPVVQLQNVMQHYNLSFNDIQKHLKSPDADKSPVEYSTRETRTENVQQKIVYVRTSPTNIVESFKEQERVPLSNDAEEKRLPPSSPCSSRTSIKSPQDHAEVAQLVKKEFDLKPEDMEQVPYANILSQYSDLTKCCCDRITKLTEMIENVRIEKERLLSPAASDKVESNGNKSGRHSNDSSTNTSMSQDAVDRYLLDVSSQQCPSTYQANQDVHELPGIPKYTEPTDNQAMNFLNSPVKQFLLNSKTKPPPSLLRSNKYNLNIDMTPHELSTIVELDTLVSSRNVSTIVIPRAPSPEEKIPSRNETVPEKLVKDNDASGFVTITPEYFKISPEEQTRVPCKCPQTSEHLPRKSALKKSSRSSSPGSNSGLSGINPINSDRSTSSPEDMEVILRSMGLSWAVSTLKKTHEAMALSSSSSSVETSFRKRVSFKNSSNSNSDIDLSEIREPTDLNRDGSQHRDSDISSVRLHSEELFLSIPNLSLDTNKSLSKLKE